MYRLYAIHTYFYYSPKFYNTEYESYITRFTLPQDKVNIICNTLFIRVKYILQHTSSLFTIHAHIEHNILTYYSHILGSLFSYLFSNFIPYSCIHLYFLYTPQSTFPHHTLLFHIMIYLQYTLREPS